MRNILISKLVENLWIVHETGLSKNAISKTTENSDFETFRSQRVIGEKRGSAF